MMMRGNREVIDRFREAAAYQRKAVRCLIPERLGGHLDVIGNELKLMLTEAAADILKDCVGQAFCSAGTGYKKETDIGESGCKMKKESERKGSRKIDIL